MADFTREKLASYLDHTILKPESNQADVEKVVDEALEYQCHTVCVLKQWLPLVAGRLKGSKVIPITVISFPHGNSPTARKVLETEEAIGLGAREIDMVLNRELLKAKDYAAVLKDVSSVVTAAGPIPVKVILETSELDADEKVAACVLSKLAGAKFVKTSTGFSKSGATVEDIALMRKVVGEKMGVKASGGIRQYEDAIKMIRAGATRIGTSSTAQILDRISGQSAGGY